MDRIGKKLPIPAEVGVTSPDLATIPSACKAGRCSMTPEEGSLIERVQSSFGQLSAASANLNAISDELGKSVSEIDSALKRLNLGVSVWVAIRGNDWQDLSYESEQIGYAKIDGKWGLGLRTVSGNHKRPDDESVHEWSFNDAPRFLRVGAIEKLPELLEQLTKEAEATARKISESVEQAKSVAAAISRAVPQSGSQRK
jgi:hypothetical protein